MIRILSKEIFFRNPKRSISHISTSLFVLTHDATNEVDMLSFDVLPGIGKIIQQPFYLDVFFRALFSKVVMFRERIIGAFSGGVAITVIRFLTEPYSRCDNDLQRVHFLKKQQTRSENHVNN